MLNGFLSRHSHVQRIRLHVAVIVLFLSTLPLTFAIAGSFPQREAKPLRQVPPTFAFEFEDLVAGSQTSPGYKVVRQDMQGFGKGWSGNAQLFWGLPPCGTQQGPGQYTNTIAPYHPGPKMTVQFDLPEAGRYEAVLHYTAAPDFGRFNVAIGTDVGFVGIGPDVGYDGYATNVTRKTVNLGQLRLNRGLQKLEVMINGRYIKSSGCSVGLDRLDLLKIDSTVTKPQFPTPVKTP